MALEQEINHLKELLLKMNNEVLNNLIDALDAYFGKKDVEYINDDIVDTYETLIEELCIKILLRERPYASDLKQVTGILKLVADVERIGDHAEDILEFTKYLANNTNKHSKEIDNLAKYVLNMLQNAINAYINNDLEKAKEVINSDDYVDNEYHRILELLSENKNNEDYMHFAIYNTLVVKYLERIADHSVNISEWIIYISSGFHKDKKIY